MTLRKPRLGSHARAVMSDLRWSLLPLSARAVWIHLTDIADVMPTLRAPAKSDGVSLDEIARLLSAEASEVAPALEALATHDVIAVVGHGFRLKAF